MNARQTPTEKLNRTYILTAQREEEKREEKMKNRIKFLSQEKNKQNQAIQQAKKKYEKLVEIRNTSLHEKETLKKVVMDKCRK